MRKLENVKYIFVTGGVVSGLGKGITAASIGRLLKERGLKVAAQKFDPYINVDPGTMSPLQHGEVFVTDDGTETDLDLGHYERFIDESLNRYSSVSTGKIFTNVLQNERDGIYLGKTIQYVPHITNEIKRCMYHVAEFSNPDVVISEIGGTVGDIELQPYLEAIRQIANELGKDNVLNIHVALVPYLRFSCEYKTKPVQRSVRELSSAGIQPSIIVCRIDADEPLDRESMDKISMFCNVSKDCVLENRNTDILYEIPLVFEDSNFSNIICRELKINPPPSDTRDWRAMIERVKNVKGSVHIALIGKYIKLHDAYLSVIEALKHGGYESGVSVNIEWIDSECVTAENVDRYLKNMDGIIVPGGFGVRGTQGMIEAIHYARCNDIPFFGICLGMQMAVVEFARTVMGLADANSGEFSEMSEHKVIDLMPEQKTVKQKGATMRLGKYPCAIVPNSKLEQAYKTDFIEERHRHRFEVNNDYRELMEKYGMIVCGQSPDRVLVEAVEIPANRWHLGVQYHPEFKSRPNRAHPLFREFVAAAKAYHLERSHGKN